MSNQSPEQFSVDARVEKLLDAIFNFRPIGACKAIRECAHEIAREARSEGAQVERAAIILEIAHIRVALQQSGDCTNKDRQAAYDAIGGMVEARDSAQAEGETK